MPPKVKCIITNEFHYYDDECNCEEARASKVEELAKIKEQLNEPIIAYSSDLTGGQLVWDGTTVHEGTLMVSDPFDVANVSYDTVVGATDCLVCGEPVSLRVFEHGPRICESCKKAIKFIKERFKEELYD
jgi:hypothetical protein